MPNYIALDQAAAIVRRAERLKVIGCSGGGKSTLAQNLARRLDLPFISLDRDVIWLPGWTMRPRAEQRALTEAATAGARWIIDGTSPSTFDLRLPRTDLVVWVRMPRLLCIWGVVTRWLKFIGRTRPEMAPGCREKIDWAFLRYVGTFDRAFAPRVVSSLDQSAPDVPVVQLYSRSDMRRLLDLAALGD